ncbi:MAG: hypothetical protein JRI23_14970 [Deltaproteobacteria bacterium]|nr:hypothetical protein [Deltaproteobacteria bacterium]MBW2533052.1 hypothetical protein [Deltaproteobacteria bacterium]
MFFARPSSVNRLVLELQGGGGCWSEEACFIRPRAVTTLRREPDLADELANVGIHDKDDPDNPVADWHHVIVSYCTGDLHWGSEDVPYGSRTFYHRGATNVRAVLQWLGEQVWAPEQILVIGHSAGAYGSILWAPWVARRRCPVVPVVSVSRLGPRRDQANGNPDYRHRRCALARLAQGVDRRSSAGNGRLRPRLQGGLSSATCKALRSGAAS